MMPHRDHTSEYLDLVSFQNLFNARLNTYLDAKISSYKGIIDTPLVIQVFEHAVSLARHGGKRVRPYMCFSTYCIEGGENIEEALRIGMGLELFHVFALIHDDIIDKAKERHGKPTTHEYAGSVLDEYPRGDKKHVAESFAILAGDLIFSWASEIMTSVQDERVRTIFFSMIEEVVAGQMLDVSFMLRYEVERETIMRKNELKTALYSFVNPMCIGAALAQSTRHTEFYRTLGLFVGQAFQIQDDLLDIVGSHQKTGKVPFIDIRDGQHTILSQYIFEHASKSEKEVFLSLFGTQIVEQDYKRLSDVFVSTGAIAYAEKEVHSLLEKATELVASSDLDQKGKGMLYGLIQLLGKRNS